MLAYIVDEKNGSLTLLGVNSNVFTKRRDINASVLVYTHMHTVMFYLLS